MVALALAVPVLAADFAQPRPGMEALILPVEVLGGPTGAFQYYNGGSRTSAARTYQFSGRETNR